MAFFKRYILLKKLFAIFLIGLLFTPFFNTIYDTYIENHNFHCSATHHDNHLHNEHKYFYQIIVSNENYLIPGINFSFQTYYKCIVSNQIISDSFFKTTFSKIFFIRPPPFYVFHIF
jgi:hypothetical protein